MDHVLLGVVLCSLVVACGGETYLVRVGTEQHVNLVDEKFVSFTIDPKYLFTSSDKYQTKECICMASSLSPAYLRVAGASTTNLRFRNTSIALQEEPEPSENDDDYSKGRKHPLSISHKRWERFVKWAKSTGFELVFALNNEERTVGGMWDPNTALRVLSGADNSGVGDIYWQLGYECTNQSIEEYLNDLETLRVIIETFPPGKAGRWRVVGGDISHCLQAESKSDFKDYVTLSNDMMDAVLLNGNSTSRELARMSDKDRLQLLQLLSRSTTPLWLTEDNQLLDELGRAADWMTSLGYSARNGFAVHYRELLQRELYEPTLSFYMALLFKNLVGERVLSVDIDAPQAMLFAHCTTLRHKPVPGAITLYGVNMEDEPARFSIKLSQTEEGGDIMQFILGHDHSGNIVVNGRPMYYEGDIKPVVRRIRPYKTLLINLPPKSFGFWVLANTKVEACQNVEDEVRIMKEEKVYAAEDKVVAMVKRSVEYNDVVTDSNSSENQSQYKFIIGNLALKARIDDINNNLKSVHRMIRTEPRYTQHSGKTRRDVINRSTKPHREKLSVIDELLSKIHNPLDYNGSFMEKIAQFKESNLERLRQAKSLLMRRHSRKFKRRSKSDYNGLDTRNHKKYEITKQKNSEITKQNNRSRKRKTNDRLTDQMSNEKGANVDVPSVINKRTRRSINNEHRHLTKKEIATPEKDVKKKSNESGKVDQKLRKVRKISNLPSKRLSESSQNDDYYDDLADGIILNTKISDDSATVSIHDESKSGTLKSTLQDAMGFLGDLNKKINRFWSAITVLE